jgi:hypothetical protein
MAALAGTHNFIADWGVDFTRAVIKKDNKKRVVPLVGAWTALMVVHAEDHFTQVLMSLTTENGGIVIDGPRGLLALYATKEQMTEVLVGKYHHYIDLIDPDGLHKERMLRGSFTVREP